MTENTFILLGWDGQFRVSGPVSMKAVTDLSCIVRDRINVTICKKIKTLLLCSPFKEQFHYYLRYKVLCFSSNPFLLVDYVEQGTE